MKGRGNAMRKLATALAALSLLGTAVWGQDPADTAVEPTTKHVRVDWAVVTQKSLFTGKSTITLSTPSDFVPDAFSSGRTSRFILVLRCQPHHLDTSKYHFEAFITFPRGYQTAAGKCLSYRIDDNAPVEACDMLGADGNNVLSFHNAASFTKGLLGKRAITMEVPTQQYGPVSVAFNIAGLEERLPGLQEFCPF